MEVSFSSFVIQCSMFCRHSLLCCLPCFATTSLFLALRDQIGVLQRSARKRPKLSAADRFLWAWLSGVWSDWRSVLVILKPETVIGWHRHGFRLFWTWKIRRGRTGRPAVPLDLRDLIRRMSRENPAWGAPRNHGELLKLGIASFPCRRIRRSRGRYSCRKQDESWRSRR
jgi:hypothetical protein